MSSMKFSLLALASTVAAIPHYGAGAHSNAHHKYHSSVVASGAHGTGVKPYPTGGWNGAYNSTRVPYPTGTGVSDEDTTIELTATSTTTLFKTVVVKPSPAPGADESDDASEANVSGVADEGKCGPATVTVTAAEKVTITVTPGGGADVPKSSAAVPVESKGDGYGVPVVVSSTVLGEEAKPTPVVSSKVEDVKPTPVVSSKAEEALTTPAPEVPSKAPEAPSSKVEEEYKISSIVQKPIASVVESSAAPVKTPSSGGYAGNKRGLAYNKAELCKTLGSKFGFGYNWAQVENNDIGAPFIPLMHGPTKGSSSEWLKNVDKAVAKGSTAVMGFNEPDHAEQANLTPEAACAAWKEYMNPIASAHPDLKIISPSVTNGPAPMGLDWLSRFHDACPDAVVHATNIHFYDIYEAATIERFKAQVEKAIQIYNKPVWVTEFGLNPGSATPEQAASFLKEAMEYLDNNDKVEGYAWFMVGEGENMLNSGSGLSPLGQVYANGY